MGATTIFSSICVSAGDGRVTRCTSGVKFRMLRQGPRLTRGATGKGSLLICRCGLYPRCSCCFRLFTATPCLRPRAVRRYIGHLATDRICSSIFATAGGRNFC